MAMYVTGNLNLFDAKHAKAYGYESVKAYQEDFIEQWYEDVKTDDDHIYILGNLSQYAPETALALIQSLPGQKHLMAGPRDLISPDVKKGWVDSDKYNEVFVSTNTATRRRLLGQDCILSHYGPDSDSWWAPRKTEAFYVTAYKDIPALAGPVDPGLPWVSPTELTVSWHSWTRLVNWEEIKEMFHGRTVSPDTID